MLNADLEIQQKLKRQENDACTLEDAQRCSLDGRSTVEDSLCPCLFRWIWEKFFIVADYNIKNFSYTGSCYTALNYKGFSLVLPSRASVWLPPEITHLELMLDKWQWNGWHSISITVVCLGTCSSSPAILFLYFHLANFS